MGKPEVIRTAQFSDNIRSYIFAYVALILGITFIGIPLLIVWVAGVGQKISRRYYESLECQLTTHHLAYKKGAIFKVEKTIPLENIQDLTFIQNPILNYFDLRILKIETAGNSRAQAADMKLVGITDAEEFKEAVLRQREKLKDNVNLPNSSASSDETVELLREIRDLLKNK